jgi:hypothetical protein
MHSRIGFCLKHLLFAVPLLTPITSYAQTQAELRDAIRNALPGEVTTGEMDSAIKAGVWDSNRRAVAISIIRASRPTILLVILKLASGRYKAIDISETEGANLGVLGIARWDAYDRVETTPVKWLPRNDGYFQVVVRTKASKNGKQYSMEDSRVITSDGTPIYR